MNSNEIQTILLEILRIGLIAIRNLSEYQARSLQDHERLKLWTDLCHTLPSVLLGKCNERAVRHFLQWGINPFCRNYPAPEHSDFRQIVELRTELEALLSNSSPG